MHTTNILNQEAFEFAIREYAISMKLIKVNSNNLKISTLAEEAIEAAILSYLIKSKLFPPLPVEF